MITFAEVLNGVVRYVGTADTLPQFAPPLLAVDITAVFPGPKEGWLYDTKSGAFSAPPPPEPPPAPMVDADAEEVKTLLAKSDGTFTLGDLASLLKQIAKRVYGV